MQPSQVLFVFFSLLACSAVQAVVVPEPLTKRTLAPFSDFTNNVVLKPGADYSSWKTIYARTLQLPDGSHLITWENYPPEPPLVQFPIWKSVGGVTWASFANVSDEANGWGLRYQPHLYLLEQDFGEYEAGTIILTGMSVKVDLSEAWLDMYTSPDGGATWAFASHVVYAPGPETTTNGDKAVWEPFLLMYEDQIICYFSDQRDPAHAQKLAHVVTSDLKTWSAPVDDVTYDDYDRRPGMATVAHIESANKWIMTYEQCAAPEGGCPAYYKVASSPYDFNSTKGIRIVSNSSDAINPGSSPFVLCVPHPDRSDGSGLVFASGSEREEIFVNEDDASPDGWKMVSVGAWTGHSRCLEPVIIQGERRLMLSDAGLMESGHDNYVVDSVVPIPT